MLLQWIAASTLELPAAVLLMSNPKVGMLARRMPS
jgi:hypothetical protein